MIDLQHRASFRIEGNQPLSGTIKPQGNKNEALPLLAACCLSDEPIELSNLPAIEDVSNQFEILDELGADITFPKESDLTRAQVCAKNVSHDKLPRELCAKSRGSVTFAGPLLAKHGHVVVPKPGGDRIGRRRLDTHILALQQLGAEVVKHPKGYELKAKQLKGADILLDETSVTATENAVCAATLAKGKTIIRNAASEPHVQGLCQMLVKMGAKILGIGSNILEVEGVKSLGGAKHKIGPDYLEVGSFISLAAVTGGELVIEQVDTSNLRMIRLIFHRLGIETLEEKGNLRVPAKQDMKIISDLGGAIPKIEDAPWPGFPADMTSVALVTATQCGGTILIHEKMFESRLYFTDPLISMGARIVLCDPHRAVVIGPERLKGARLVSPDIRAGMAMLIAALCAHGESTIQNIVQIDRGFSHLDERLRSLGAKIEREE
ncbi:MAG: UDP-N-acetylglucosamine 1-carboxyvinyltransferase [Verrucomicrobiota bacterium]